jgi:hypothetical protein
VWRLRGYWRRERCRERQAACISRTPPLPAGLAVPPWVLGGPGDHQDRYWHLLVPKLLVLGSVSIPARFKARRSVICTPSSVASAGSHLAAHPAAKSIDAEWLTLTLAHMNLEPALPPSACRANTTSAVPRVALCTTHLHAPLSRLPPTRPLLHTRPCSACSACSVSSVSSAPPTADKASFELHSAPVARRPRPCFRLSTLGPRHRSLARHALTPARPAARPYISPTHHHASPRRRLRHSLAAAAA